MTILSRPNYSLVRHSHVFRCMGKWAGTRLIEPTKVTVASVFISGKMANSVKRVQFVYKQSRSHDCGYHVNKHSIHSSDIHFHHETSLV